MHRIPSRPSLLRSVRPLPLAGGLGFAAALAAVAGADVGTTFTVVVREGDAIPGVGNVTAIDTVAVNSAGTTVVEVDTDHPSTDFDGVVLRNGAIVARQGDSLAAPAGATISSFGSGGPSIDGNGTWAWNYSLDGLTTSTDSGIYRDNTLVLQEGAISTASAFTPGTPYIGFFGAKINDANRILVMASIEDLAIASTVDRALVVLQVDNAGTLLSETVLAKEGDVLAGQTDAIADFETGTHAYDFDDAGNAMFVVDLGGLTTTDSAIYLGTTLLAQEGSPSPVAATNWASLASSEVALSAGHHAYTGVLSGSTATDNVIVVDGAVAVREGDAPPDVAGAFTLTGFGTGAIEIDDGGNLYWFGDWNDANTSVDTGIFRNDQLLVQEGVTTIGGQIVESIASVQENFAVSADGRWLIFEGALAGGISGAFLIEMDGGVTSYCTAGTTSNGCNATITATGAASASLATNLLVDVAGVEGQKTGLIFYGISGPAALTWGTGSSFLCVKAPTQRTSVQLSGGTAGACDGAFALDWNAYLGSHPGSLGQPFQAGDQVWMQSWFRDPPASKTTNLSDAIEFTVQP